MIASDTIVRWHADQLGAEIDNQVVVMGLAQGKYVGFDDIASNVWRRLEHGPTVGRLCEDLARDFDGDPEVIRCDVIDLLVKLQELGLISVEPAADTGPDAPGHR